MAPAGVIWEQGVLFVQPRLASPVRWGVVVSLLPWIGTHVWFAVGGLFLCWGVTNRPDSPLLPCVGSWAHGRSHLALAPFLWSCSTKTGTQVSLAVGCTVLWNISGSSWIPGRGLLSQGCRAELKGPLMGLASRGGGFCGDVTLLQEGSQEPGRSWPWRDLQLGLGCVG